MLSVKWLDEGGGGGHRQYLVICKKKSAGGSRNSMVNARDRELVCSGFPYLGDGRCRQNKKPRIERMTLLYSITVVPCRKCRVCASMCACVFSSLFS